MMNPDRELVHRGGARSECWNTMQTFSVIQSEWSAELKSLLRIGLLIAGHQSILIQGGWMIV